MLSRTASNLIRRHSTIAARTFGAAAASSSDSFAAARIIVVAAPRGPVHQRRQLSSTTHDDFGKVQKEEVSNEVDEAVEMIAQHVKDNPVMLYMKGNPSMPMCGFSAKMVQTLQAEGIDFSSVNVLEYPSIREGVKKFAAWPTIPQLYVNGEFIGGTDIVTDMQASGELKDLLTEAKAAEEKKE